MSSSTGSPGSLDQFLQIAVQNGELTEDQAQACARPLGTSDARSSRMTSTDTSRRDLTPVVDVEIVVPVHNEERALRPSILALHDYLEGQPWTHRIVIADNASTDATQARVRP